MFRPLKQSSFLKLYIAQVFSDLGNWLDFIALNVIIAYRWELGPEMLAAETVAFGLPWIFFGPVFAVYTDRFSKRIAMGLSHVLRILTAIGFIFVPNILLLLALILIKETISALYDPLQQGAIQMLVPRELLPEASSLSQLSSNTAKIAAPALGGLLIALNGPKTVFLIEAAGFLASAILVFRLYALDTVIQTKGVKRESLNGFRKEFLSGLAFIRANKTLKIAVYFMSARIFLIFLYDSMLVIWVKGINLSESAFAWLISAIGLGSVLGSLIFGHWKGWVRKPLVVMGLASAFSGGMVLFIALIGYGFRVADVYLLSLMFLVFGMVGAAVPTVYGYLVQSQTVPDLLGRVVSTANALQNCFMLSAPLIGAILAKISGINAVFAISGVFTCLLGIVILIQGKRYSGAPLISPDIS